MASSPPGASSSGLRLKVLAITVACLLVALLARLWDLQVIAAPQSRLVAAQNGIETVYTPAPRGEILDRNGVVLASNEQVPVITVPRDESSDTLLVGRLAALLGMTDKAVRAAIGNDQYTSLQPVPVDASPTPAQMLYIQEHPSSFPGVVVTTQTERHVTAAGEAAAAIIGYVGRVTGPELTALQKQDPAKHYTAEDVVGQSGVEAEYQNFLAGTPGTERLEVNAQGKVVGVAGTVPPVPGDNVVLSIDINVQLAADTAIVQGQAQARATPAGNGSNYQAPGGSAVVEDPNNGQILAMATEPTFDPNLFDQGISQAQYQSYRTNPADPLENRAIQGQYAPGSTFKVVTGTAGLHYGVVTPTSLYDDKGVIDLNGYLFHDDAGIGYGWIAMPEALTVSSDNYFNQIGISLWDGRSAYGPTALQDVAGSYGFGLPSGIDLYGENVGLIPTPATLQKEHQQNPLNPGYWVTGDSAEMAIGQFQVEVTPLQMADAYSAFANGGTLYRPQVVLDVQTPSGKIVQSFQSHVNGHPASLTPAERQAMIQGYLGVTHNPLGTAYPVFNHTLAGFSVAGKTGTAQVQTATGQTLTSVFVGFAPSSGTKYVVDSFVEDAGYGESVSAPIVRAIMDSLFHQPVQPVSYVSATGNAT